MSSKDTENIIQKISLDGGATTYDIKPLGVTEGSNEVVCPELTSNTTLELQRNKLASAGTNTIALTAIYLNRTDTTKYPTAKAVYEYIQSLY
jgi:hypothetical protein